MYERLRNRTECVKEEAVEFTQRLVQTPSVSLNEGRVADLVEEKMNELGYDEVVRDELGNVIGVMFARNAETTAMLNSHMDTVSAECAEQWEHPPYSGRIEGDRLYGLGTADCKAGLAAQIYAGAILKRSLLPLEGNLVVAATVAEENGRSIGVNGLLERTLPEMGLRPDYAILGEPTGLGLYYGHDGWAEFEIQIEGANAFHVDDAAGAILKEIHPESHLWKTAEQVQSWTIHKPFFEDTEGVRRATIPMDRRLHQTEDLGEILGQIKHNARLVAQAAGSVAVDVLVKEDNQEMYTGRTTVVKHVTHAWETDPFHPIMERSRQALAAAGCTVRPGKFKLDRLGMGTAGSNLLGQFRVPTIGYGPGLEEAAHSVGEYVELSKITETIYGTASIIHSLIGMPVFGWTSDEI